MTTFVTHLESALDGTRFPAGQVHTVHQGRPLWVRYDLASVGRAVTADDLARRPPTMWRYRELLPLPLDAEPVTLEETDDAAAALPAPWDAAWVCRRLLVKDESQLPTGSFKSRGMTAAVSMAQAPGPAAAGGADGRQRRRRPRGLRRARRHGSLRLHAAGHADHQPDRGAPGRGEGIPGQRPHHRLRPPGARRDGHDGLVRHFHAQGALPAGRQENDGPGACRADGLPASRRDPLPHRRRHGTHRHVESLRGAE